MNRRDFITLLGGGAAAWPLAARAQQSAMPVIGFLNSASPEAFRPNVAGFRQGLQEAGYVEGKNIAIDYRWAGGQYSKLPAPAAELVSRKVSVIAATGGIASARSAKEATASIPIVFVTGNDPVNADLVPNFNRPGGNVTGVAFLVNTLGAKRLELLREVIPGATTIGMLVNPTNPDVEPETKDMRAAAGAIGRELIVVNAATERELDQAFSVLAKEHTRALTIAGDPFFATRGQQLAELAARYSLPAINPTREFADAGGLMSYGTSVRDAYRQAGSYVARILRGEKPADLPVLQPTKFELVINLKTANALGLRVPNTLLVSADEVIE
jgi:putative ABC transport system substrate-binding protein